MQLKNRQTFEISNKLATNASIKEKDLIQSINYCRFAEKTTENQVVTENKLDF